MQKHLGTILVLVGLGLGAILFTSPVSAQCEDDPFQQPTNCGSAGTAVDFACQRERILDPTTTCCVHKCAGSPDFSETSSVLNLNFFGIGIRAKSSLYIQTLLYVGFNLFLGVAALAVTFYGIWGAYIRAQAESDDDVIKSAKILQNALIGVAIIAMSFLIAQLIANFLGLGSINEIVNFSNLGLDQ